MEEEETQLLKVHAIIEGPYHTFDVVDDEGMYEGMDTYFCLAKVEVDGEVSDEELHFETFPEFYEMKAWLDKYIEPYEIEMVREKYEG